VNSVFSFRKLDFVNEPIAFQTTWYGENGEPFSTSRAWPSIRTLVGDAKIYRSNSNTSRSSVEFFDEGPTFVGSRASDGFGADGSRGLFFNLGEVF